MTARCSTRCRRPSIPKRPAASAGTIRHWPSSGRCPSRSCPKETGTIRPCPIRRGSRVSTIPVFKPLLGPEEIGAATQALELGWLGMGSYVGQFEEALRQFLNAEDRHVVAVSTGHAALHLALLAAGVGPGD